MKYSVIVRGGGNTLTKIFNSSPKHKGIKATEEEFRELFPLSRCDNVSVVEKSEA